MIRFVDGDQETSEGPSPPRQEKPKDDIFFKSPNLHVRFLSSLVILKTLNQGRVLTTVNYQLFGTLFNNYNFYGFRVGHVIWKYIDAVSARFLGRSILCEMATDARLSVA